jgi:sulfotransferase family protein
METVNHLSRTWMDYHKELAVLARKQLFFVGGAPRSGTTWVQQILDAHPEISCRGEGLFQKHLAEPLGAMLAQRSAALAAKNAGLFAHTGGYPLPSADDAEYLLGTGVLLALHWQSAGKTCGAIGEKTPENVFFFPRLKQLFPSAKCIAIARDPRDVLTSAWHFFHKPLPDEDETAAKFAFIELALPSLNLGARAIIDLGRLYPTDVLTITYEDLCRTPERVVASMFRFLSVSDTSHIVVDAIARTSFVALTGGRMAGVERNGAFLRKGVTRDWASTLTSEMSDLVIRELGWMFPRFGWKL